MEKRFKAGVLAAFVIVAGGASAFVLYSVDDRSLRLTLGVSLMVFIFWAATRLSIAENTVDLVTPPLHPRRFTKLRADVEKLLGDIRRLNWIAVDGERGVRDREQTTELMDAIETRLKDQIDRIRASAGQSTEEELQEHDQAGS